PYTSPSRWGAGAARAAGAGGRLDDGLGRGQVRSGLGGVDRLRPALRGVLEHELERAVALGGDGTGERVARADRVREVHPGAGVDLVPGVVLRRRPGAVGFGADLLHRLAGVAVEPDPERAVLAPRGAVGRPAGPAGGEGGGAARWAR